MTFTETDKALSCTFGVKPHALQLSSAFGVAAKATITIDDRAFPCEIAGSINGRAQTIVTGTIKGKAYKPDGIYCNLTRQLAKKFPLGNYRVVVTSELAAYLTYPLFDQANNRLKIYTDVGTEMAADTDISSKEFQFIAVGE